MEAVCKGDGAGGERQELTLTVNLMGYKSPRRQTLGCGLFQRGLTKEERLPQMWRRCLTRQRRGWNRKGKVS